MINLTGSRANAKLQPAVIYYSYKKSKLQLTATWIQVADANVHIVVSSHYHSQALFSSVQNQNDTPFYTSTLSKEDLVKNDTVLAPPFGRQKWPEKADALKIQPWNQDSLHLWDSHLQTQITIHFSQNPLPSSHT